MELLSYNPRRADLSDKRIHSLHFSDLRKGKGEGREARNDYSKQTAELGTAASPQEAFMIIMEAWSRASNKRPF